MSSEYIAEFQNTKIRSVMSIIQKGTMHLSLKSLVGKAAKETNIMNSSHERRDKNKEPITCQPLLPL